jgi:hypothetical protein
MLLLHAISVTVLNNPPLPESVDENSLVAPAVGPATAPLSTVDPLALVPVTVKFLPDSSLPKEVIVTLVGALNVIVEF